MSSDPNKKSPRTFQCRDMLWETFEQMARELECSVDYLINEAMKQYARQRSYGGTGSVAVRTPPGGQPMQPIQQRDSSLPASSQQNAMATPAVPPPPQMRTSGPLPPPPPRGGGGGLPPPPARGGGGLPMPPGRPMGVSAPPFAPPGLAPPQRGGMPQVPSRPPPPASPRSVPPPIPRGGLAPPQVNGYAQQQAQAPAATLSCFYQGDKVPVTKERFVIGRGKQSSDLTLKDPNVSRQHAMVEFQNGVYFMVDMGSTNGVEYNGQRIARKQIAEGDVFRICDHDLRFTYR